jgi:hypothetical protein
MAHGFLGDSSGTFTSFDVPGAVFYSLAFDEGPQGSSLNPSGDATGGYVDANSTMHGFVRDRSGAITTFDAPGADIKPGDFAGTLALSINPTGEVTGFYIDASFFTHGFLRDANGNITEFDAPGATTACPFGLTYPQGINAVGEIVGAYYNSQCNAHGFLREPNGAFTVVDVPSYAYTFPITINDRGEIAGFVINGAGVYYAFIRDHDGSFTVFEVPNVNQFGVAMDISSAGMVVGWYYDGSAVSHGFRRTPDGTLTIIDCPGAGTGLGQGTYATSINAAGDITGKYIDANGVPTASCSSPTNAAGLPSQLARNAEALHLADRTSEALEAIDEAEPLAERFGNRYWCAELHRLRDVFLAAMGADETQVEASFSAAIRTAKEQKSVSLEKRAEATYAEYRRQKASGSEGRGFRLPLW